MTLVSFVISTYNRRDVLLDTLTAVGRCGLSADQFEVIVVDNASTDGTAEAVAVRFPHVTLIRESVNRGPCAKNAAVAVARGVYVMFLDDDSFPADADCVPRMLRHFESDARLGAAVCTVTLPDGSRECSAYPDVFIGCGTGFRAAALHEVGGLPQDFFMAAEEYDLSLRLLDAGWRVLPFADLHVTHLKSPGARNSERVTELDVRNNLLLLARYFPDEWATAFARDWTRRYRMIARINGHKAAFVRGRRAGVDAARAVLDEGRRPVAPGTFESFAKIDETEHRFREQVAARGARRVLFIDLGKNVLAYWRAAQQAGVTVAAIADARLGGHGFRYRGVELVDDARAAGLLREDASKIDALVLSNLSPVHAAARRVQWRRLTDLPVIDLFEA